MAKESLSMLAEELLAMAQADRDMRNGLQKGGAWNPSVDEHNTKRMHEIIDQHGWPKVSDVGKEAASAAWLLVQHADFDPDFQICCLEMIQRLPEGEVLPSDQAYLEDRVLINTGKPQKYGSQFTGEGANFRPHPIEDIEHLDERRARVGLQPFADYEKVMHEIHRKHQEAKGENHGNI